MSCNFFKKIICPKNMVFKSFKQGIIPLDFGSFVFRTSKLKNDINYIKYKFSHSFEKLCRWLNMYYSKSIIIIIKKLTTMSIWIILRNFIWTNKEHFLLLLNHCTMHSPHYGTWGILLGAHGYEFKIGTKLWCMDTQKLIPTNMNYIKFVQNQFPWKHDYFHSIYSHCTWYYVLNYIGLDFCFHRPLHFGNLVVLMAINQKHHYQHTKVL
jgi:hypothetical protein